MLALVALALAAAPPPQWMGYGDDTAAWHASRDRRAPQQAKPDAFYKAAPPALAEFSSGVLACRVQASIEVKWDALAEPDLLVTLALPGWKPELVLYGPEDRYVAYFSVPGVSLAKGAALSMKVEDRDVTGNELIGEATAKFDGALPVRFSAENFEAECRGISQQTAAQQAAPLFGKLDQAIAGFAAQGKPDLGAVNLGVPSATGQLTKPFADVARLVTWSEPQLEGRFARVDALLAEWRSRLAKQIDEKAAKTTASKGAAGALDVKLVAVKCGTECEVQVELTNRTTRPVEVRERPLLLFAGGDSWETDDPLSDPVPPKGTVTVRFETTCKAWETCAKREQPKLVRWGTGLFLRPG